MCFVFSFCSCSLSQLSRDLRLQADISSLTHSSLPVISGTTDPPEKDINTLLRTQLAEPSVPIIWVLPKNIWIPAAVPLDLEKPTWPLQRTCNEQSPLRPHICGPVWGARVWMCGEMALRLCGLWTWTCLTRARVVGAERGLGPHHKRPTSLRQASARELSLIEN